MPLSPSKIKSRRLALHLTQCQAAARAGMPQPAWVRIEHGDRPDPALSTALRVAAALGLPLPAILDPAACDKLACPPQVG
jgi:transcriptional regulator with XRE-family HTH domain